MLNIPTIELELYGPINIYVGLGVEIITAFILGGAIGIDRQKKLKPAGIKTNMLICIGATLYTAISLILQKSHSGTADPNRVAAQIVSGIGFLGAGAIMKGGVGIIGLTTAATIWVVAAIGVTIGSGYPIIASIFTITILVILKILNPLYEFFEVPLSYHIEVLSQGSVIDQIKELVLLETGKRVEVIEEKIDVDKGLSILHLEIKLQSKQLTNLLKNFGEVIQVNKVHYREVEENGHGFNED